MSDCVNCLIQKDRRWLRRLLGSLAITVLLTAVYTWVVGRVGMEASITEFEIPMEDGMFWMNLGCSLFVNAGLLLIAIVRHLWSSHRAKTKSSGKFVGISLLMAAAFVLAAIPCVRDERVFPSRMDEGTARVIMVGFAAVGVAALVWAFKMSKEEKSAQKDAAAVPQQASPQAGSAGQTPPRAGAAKADDAGKYDLVIGQRKRLIAAGDYASLIPLLIQATELNVDNARKAKLWNYLGMAYESVNSAGKSEECYRTALQFDANNPSSLCNLALGFAAAGDMDAARRYVQASVNEAERRGSSLGVYYEKYAYVYGLSGDKQVAELYLQKAAANGGDEASLQQVRRSIGLT